MEQKREGYSLRKGRLIRFLKKNNFTLEDIAAKIEISERELQERLDDWDYFNAEEIERLVEFVGAKAAYDIIFFPTRKEKEEIKKKAFRRNRWAKRKE
ncbi:MAG: hypothetical protein IJ506_07315 [Clostridia bacterium]|nr:hypothetical protein [Clostridia bacterium]